MRQLFVEVRCEELPARWGAPAVEVLADKLKTLLEGIPFGEVKTWYTPRRLAVAINDVSLERPKTESVLTGPPWAASFKNGVPTKAAIGFATSRGVEVADLFEVETKRGVAIGARIVEGGQPTSELLAKGLEQAILSIPFKKTLRWGDNSARWARPIQGVCALLDGKVIDAVVAGIKTSNTSIGHRLRPEPFLVTNSEDWEQSLKSRYVIADPVIRKTQIRNDLLKVAKEHGVFWDETEALIEEVNDLVEWPVVVAGRLPEHLMHLPPRLLIESMRVHQRIFNTLNNERELSPVFLAVSNNPFGDSSIISAGNTRVLTARFEDARFFYDEDLKITLDDRLEKLAKMQWVRGLGTMAEKSVRLIAISSKLSNLFGADSEMVQRAAELCKADLVSHMVGEFPELQGHVGQLYAKKHGEKYNVAMAIEEHYLPRFAEDTLPQTSEGRVLALADRLDTLLGCFSIGLMPKGSTDPQGLRRAANGVVSILLDANLSVSLAEIIDNVGQAGDVKDELISFILARLKAQLQGEGIPTEVITAVYAAGGDDVVALAARSRALAHLTHEEIFSPLKIAFRRVMGLTKDHFDDFAEPLTEACEITLYKAIESVEEQVREYASQLRYDLALSTMVTLKEPIDSFFDGVMVMVDDEKTRNARLGLLRKAANLFGIVADFTQL